MLLVCLVYEDSAVFYILFMELFTESLVTVSLDHGRITSNFNTIAQALKNFENRLDNLKKQTNEIQEDMSGVKNKVRHFSQIDGLHTTQLRQHKTWIDTLNSQLVHFGFEDEASQKDERETESRQTSQGRSKKQRKTIKRDSMGSADKQQQAPTSKKTSNKNIFEKAISSLKERIITLEQDNDQKTAAIQQITRCVGGKKHQSFAVKKMRDSKPHLINRSSNKNKSKKQLSVTAMDILVTDESQKKEEAGCQESVKQLGTEVFEEGMTLKTIEGQIESKVLSLEAEVARISESFKDKTRIIDLQLKQSQSKVQNLQRNLDCLERSHQLLKYEFEHTDDPSQPKKKPRNSLLPSVPKEKGSTQTADSSTTQLYEEKIVRLFEYMESIRKQYLELIARIDKQEADFPATSGEARVRIAKTLQAREEEGLQKDILECKRQVKRIQEQFSEFAEQINTGQGEKTTILIKPNETKQDWKSLSIKMHKLKLDLTGSMREMETKIVANNEIGVSVQQLEATMEEFRLMLRRKVESNDHEKALKRVETRLNNFIMQCFEKEGQENDNEASIGKQPWFCLTCDSELKSFNAKLPKPIPSQERMLGRKVNPETHMVRRNQNGRFPSVIK